MATLIGLSIDVTKIDNSKLVNGKYLNVTISVDNETGAYGNNVSAYHEQTKEQREAKENSAYLGNGKVFWTNGISKVAEKKSELATDETNDLPF